MEECLITNKVCSGINQKCKECKLDNCKEVLNMLEIQERNIYKEKLERLKKSLPEQCKSCSFLEIIDLDNKEVKCAYMIKDRCLLK